MLSLGHYTRIIPENETRAWDSTLKSLPYHKPYQQPHPPIGVAASSPQSGSIHMAGERGWIPMSSALLARPYLNGQWQLVEDGAQSAGRVANRREAHCARYFRGAHPGRGAADEQRLLAAGHSPLNGHPMFVVFYAARR